MEDLTLITEYTVFDPESEGRRSLFTLRLPEDVVVQQVETIVQNATYQSKQRLKMQR